MGDITTLFGDISPRTAAFAAAGMLKRALPLLVTERWGQAKPLPQKSSKTMKFRRYENLTRSTAPLAEGVTPHGQKLTYTDVVSTLEQFGDLVSITDVVEDTHEDNVLKEATDLCGEQAAEILEMVRIAVLKAGTNVLYANGSARTDVNTFFSRGQLRKVVRALKNQKAKYFTQTVKATPNYATEPVAPCFVGLGHTDLEADLRNLAGFVPVEKYSDSEKAFEGEVGKVENVRFILTPLFTAWADGGGTAGSMITTSASAADVYPVIILAPDAWGFVPLKGKNSVTPMVLNPGKPSKSDPLGQRGYVGWKTYHTAVILNDNFMYRIETAATLNPS